MASKESSEHHNITTPKDSSEINNKKTTTTKELSEINKENVASRESSRHRNTTSYKSYRKSTRRTSRHHKSHQKSENSAEIGAGIGNQQGEPHHQRLLSSNQSNLIQENRVNTGSRKSNRIITSPPPPPPAPNPPSPPPPLLPIPTPARDIHIEWCVSMKMDCHEVMLSYCRHRLCHKFIALRLPCTVTFVDKEEGQPSMGFCFATRNKFPAPWESRWQGGEPPPPP